MYIAMTGTEFIESHHDLAGLLAVLEEISDEDDGEDVAIWKGYQLAAVRLSSGQLVYPRGEPRQPRPAA